MRFNRSAITIFLVCYCVFLFSQTTEFSREFASAKNHIPLKIINCNSTSFCVLRYNKFIHDFTVERRSKSNFEILSFTPLMLDSINAAWFDYENLDYLFFEHQKVTYFVFEKVLNKKRAIFLKQIDSLGKSEGFKELATIDKDENTIDFRFIFKRADAASLLIVGENYYQNSTAKKVALLYDLEKNENKYVIKLPLENTTTGFSQGYESANNQLYYLLTNANLNRYRKIYTLNQQTVSPVYYTKILNLVSFDFRQKTINKANFCLSNYVEIKNFKISAFNNQVTVFMQYVDDYTNNLQKVFFLNQAYDSNLNIELYCKTTLIDSIIEQQITFYDSGDSKEATDKNYAYYKSLIVHNCNYQLSERKDENYYKELLFSKTNLDNGVVETQKIIPRKIFFFNGRTRFRNIQEIGMIEKNKTIFLFLLENRMNIKQNPNSYNFHKFKKQKYLWGANLLAYQISNDGKTQVQVIYKNNEFDAVPVKYESNQQEFIFYLNKGKKEKFAILTL